MLSCFTKLIQTQKSLNFHHLFYFLFINFWFSLYDDLLYNFQKFITTVNLVNSLALRLQKLKKRDGERKMSNSSEKGESTVL